MPFFSNGGERIHYHIEGQGTPIVLIHGLTGSMNEWYDYGYVDALKDDFNLVLVDTRGHGRSDKPATPDAYGLHQFGEDVVSLIDHLDIEKAHLWGYSYGVVISAALDKYWPQRFSSMTLGGFYPFMSKEMLETPRTILLQEGVERYIEWIEELVGSVPESGKERIRSMGSEVIASIFTAYTEEDWLNGYAMSSAIPKFMYVGDKDAFYEGAKDYSNKNPDLPFLTLPALDHMTGLQCSNVVVPQVVPFIKSVTT